MQPVTFTIPTAAPAQPVATPAAPKPAAQPDPVQKLYQALQYAETGGEKNPFIRTRVAPKSGSTAYGPVQMTGTLVRDYLKRKPDLFDEDETAFAERFVEQADKFAKFGRAPKAKGYEPRFDYGGTGELGDTPEDRALYERVAQKLIAAKWQESGGNLPKFVKAWRGADDPGYFRKVQKLFGQQ